MNEKVKIKNLKFKIKQRIWIPYTNIKDDAEIKINNNKKGGESITEYDYYICACIWGSNNYVLIDHDFNFDIVEKSMYMNPEALLIKKNSYETLSKDAKEIVDKIFYSPSDFIHSLASIKNGSDIRPIDHDRLSSKTIDRCMETYKSLSHPKRVKTYLRNNFRKKYSCSFGDADILTRKVIKEIRSFIAT